MKTAAQILKNKRAVKAELDARMPKAESDALWAGAERKLTEILERYAGIPKGERAHTDNFIFPSAAIYLTVKEAADDKTAYAVIENAAIKNSEEVGRKLKKQGYPFSCKIFPDMGHGGLIGENTERFLSEVDAAHRQSLRKKEPLTEEERI